jgi:hypothetical protein
LTTDPGLGVYGAVDVGGYVQVLLLAMQVQGVAAIPQAALASYSKQVKAAAQIPEGRLLVCTVASATKMQIIPPISSERAALP